MTGFRSISKIFSILPARISYVVLSVLILSSAGGSTSPDAELISIGIDGNAGTGSLPTASSEIKAGGISTDGRYVVFASLAENLTTDNVSGWHVYIRDRETDTTTMIADSSTMGGSPVISADGQFIAFQSVSNLDSPNDTNGSADIFVYDRTAQVISRVSVASDGSEGVACSCSWPDSCNGCEYDNVNTHPSISGDGRYVTFSSFSSNFTGGDLVDTLDVFIHDRQTGSTDIISQASGGNLGNAASGEPTISADGNFIAFSSTADNLVAEDWNSQQDVFLWSRATNNLIRVSVASDGTEGNSSSTDPVVSADGSLIAFTSGATTLASPDSNGFTYDVFIHDRVSGETSILSSGLPSGGRRPAISDDGKFVSFTSGTDDIYRYDVTSGQRQLIDDNMQFSALSNDGQEMVVSGYNSLLAADTNNDKDVYLYTLGDSLPPDDGGDDGDSQELPVDEPTPTDDSTPGIDDSNNDSSGDESSSSCTYNPNGCFDPTLPALIIAGIIIIGWKLRKHYK